MAKRVIMPKFGMTQEEATIVRWLVKEGDHVELDDPLAEVTTDKVNMEVPSPADGIIGGIRYAEGDTVPVTTIIAYILEEGEEPPEEDEATPSIAQTSKPPAPSISAPPSAAVSPLASRLAASAGLDATQIEGTGPGGRVVKHDVERALAASAPSMVESTGRVRATPAARRIARERGLDLGAVRGSGPRGRVQAADLAAPSAGLPAPGAPAQPVDIPLEGIRRTIAERMQLSAQQAPHIHLSLDVDMSRAAALRKLANSRLAPGQEKISMTAVIVYLTAWALRRHPHLNAYMLEDHIRLMPAVNIGVAVDVESGLIVPVVRAADRKSLYALGAEIADLSQRARAGRLLPDDVAEGTFTISNLGMFAVDRFTAIINPPQVAILAIGRMREVFIPDERGNPVLHPMMNVTLAADHRAVDGAMAARFLNDLQQAFEEPASLLLM